MSFDVSKLMEQVGQMQEQMQKAQDELANETVEATAVGGIVTVVANGPGEIKQVRIDPRAIDRSLPRDSSGRDRAADRGGLSHHRPARELGG